MNIFPLLVEKGLVKAEDVAALQKEVAESKDTIESVLNAHEIGRASCRERV